MSQNKFRTGIDFSATSLLRWSIALLGLTLSASVWVKLGIWGIVIVLINLIVAFAFGLILCRYILKMDSALAILLSVGTCICGASAIAATGPAIRAKAEEIGLSVAVITVFGLVAMFAYPSLFHGPLGSWLTGDPLAFGMWAGIGIHETAQVIAAASQVDGSSAIAISAKFIRVFMIGPMVFISLFLFQQFSKKSTSQKIKLAVPWFALVFVIFSLIHLGLENSPVSKYWATFNSGWLQPAVTFLLTWAFAGVGLNVKIASIKSIGLKAFLGGLGVALFAGITGLLLVKYLWL